MAFKRRTIALVKAPGLFNQNQRLEKYLTTYSEPCSRAITTELLAGCDSYQHCVVIPCYNESTAFIRRLQANVFQAGKVLAVIVLNQPAGLGLTTRLNTRIIEYLHQHYAVTARAAQFTLFASDSSASADIALVNCCTPGLPAKQGVGLARKIGCDFALQLIRHNKMTSQWLHCSDADATLPVDYFAIPKTEAIAVTYDFKHRFLKAVKSPSEQALEQASFYYEQRLRYYQRGLAYAGSPYAFYTIGSALAFRWEAYCQVRGFPRRAAGEDFYLMNKLAKLGEVEQLPQRITLKPRLSARVPFGTGPATRALLANAPRQDYNPKNFVALKCWLQQLPKICDRLINTATVDYGELPETTIQALTALKIDALWQHILQQNINTQQAVHAAHQWFDGFKTLKFIHHLTQLHFPKQCTTLIAQSPLPFTQVYTTIWSDH